MNILITFKRRHFLYSSINHFVFLHLLQNTIFCLLQNLKALLEKHTKLKQHLCFVIEIHKFIEFVLIIFDLKNINLTLFKKSL